MRRMPETDPTNTDGAHARRRKRLRRRCIRAVFVILLVVIFAGGLILTRSPLTGALVLPALEKKLGGRAVADSVVIGLDGSITLHNAKIRVPGIDGPAADVFDVKRLRADIGWPSLLSGNPVVRNLILTEPVIRVSQSCDDATVNIASLKLPNTAPSSSVIPLITVERGAIELGEHTHGAYTPLKRIDIDGRMRPTLESGAYVINLSQMKKPDGAATPSAPAAPAGFDLRGVLSDKQVSLTLRGLTLDDWRPESVPSPVRGIFALLDMKGEIAETTFDYVFAGGLQASIALKDVSLNLPVNEGGGIVDPGNADEAPLMRMHNVDGVVSFDGTGVHASGTGQLEDLPYKLDLAYTGVAVDSPFTVVLTSNDYQIGENPQIVRFAPPVVRERLATFSNPTGTVNSVIKFTRGSPVAGKAAAVKLEGRLNFRDTTAAFDKFPYRFHNMSGAVRFDDERIDILEVKGTAPSGATISAKGEIYPPNSQPTVKVDVHVDNVPIDETLKEAMGPGRRRILDAIFNEESHTQLLAEGLIHPPGSPPPANNPNAPEFALGGRATIDVTVLREPGPGSNWHEVIDVKLARAGIIPEPFPFPILADDVAISIRDNTARVVGGTYRGLRGGTATVEAETDLSKLKIPDAEVVPKIDITATAIPVDDLLVRATPGRRPDQTTDRRRPSGPVSGLSAREVLQPLHIDGLVNCRAKIDQLADGSLGYDVRVDVPSVIARAKSSGTDGPPFVMEHTTGTIRVTQDALEVDLRCNAGPLVASTASPAAEPPGTLTGTAKIDLTRGDRQASTPASRAVDVRVDGKGLDLTSPVEEVIGIFSRPTAVEVAALRGKHNPSGQVDVGVSVTQSPARPAAAGSPASPAPIAVRVDVTGGQNLAIDAADGRMGLDRAKGTARVLNTGHTRVEFDDFGGPLTFNGAPCGVISVAGGLDLSPGPEARSEPLDVELLGAAFESPVTAWVVNKKLGPGLQRAFATGKPRGLYNAAVQVTPTGPALAGATSADTNRWRVEGSIEPRSVVFTSAGSEVRFDDMTGRIEFNEGAGKFVTLSGRAPTWSWSADGSWVMETPATPAVEVTLGLDSQGLGQDLRAVLPDALLSALDEIQLQVDGPVHVPATLVRWTPSDDPARASVAAQGRISLSQARLHAGLPLTNASGSIDFAVDRRPGEPEARFDLNAALDSFEASGIAMTAGRAKVVGGEKPGEVLLPLITADCHLGRMTGQARVKTSPDGAGAVPAAPAVPAIASASESAAATTPPKTPRRYEAEISMAGVQFGPLLRDIAESSKDASPEAPGAADQLEKPAHPEDPTARGTLDAQISLAGLVGRDDSRRGRGEARIYGGQVVNYPLLMRLIRVSNLQLPINDTVELARASFFLEGGTVTFEDVSVASGSVEILGFGTVQWPALDADLRFNSRSIRRVPVLSDVLESVRDELISTSVTGKLSDPEVKAIGFQGTRALLSRIFGSGQTDQDRRLDEIQERAERERRRARAASGSPARDGE